MMRVARLDDDADVQAFEYFHHHVLSMLQLCHPSVLWTHMLGHSVQTSPLLRTIALAVGSEQRLLDTGIGSVEQNESLYGKAVRSVRKTVMTTSIDGVPLIALGCVLLILLESLRGASEDMLLHLRSGVRIVIGSVPVADQTSIDELQEVMVLLQQYCVGSWMFCTSPGYRGSLALHLQSIDFLKMTRLQLKRPESLSQRLHTAISKTIFAVRRLMNPTALPLERLEVFIHLYHLKSEIEELKGLLFTEPSDRVTSTLPPSLLFLQAKSMNTHLFLKAILDQKNEPEEVRTFMTVLDILQNALTQLRISTADEGKTVHVRTCSVGTGAIQILDTIVAVCKDPTVQRRAFGLLQLCPRREGLWKAEQTMQSISERLGTSEALKLPPKRFLATDKDDRLASSVDVHPVIVSMLEDLQLVDNPERSA